MDGWNDKWVLLVVFFVRPPSVVCCLHAQYAPCSHPCTFSFLCTAPPPPPPFPEVSPQSTPLPASSSHNYFIPSASGYGTTSTGTHVPPSTWFLLPFSSSCHERLLLLRMKVMKRERLAHFLNQPIHNNHNLIHTRRSCISPRGAHVAQKARGNLNGKSQ